MHDKYVSKNPKYNLVDNVRYEISYYHSSAAENSDLVDW